MSQEWNEVRHLAARHLATSFPDCRGEEVEGVDLVMADADVYGCVSTLMNSEARSAERIRILRETVADLDRILPTMRSEWSPYFVQVRELGVATLAVVDAT